MMLSKENIEKIVWGGLYTADPESLASYEKVNKQNPWDQRYDHWIPVHLARNGEDQYYMINTYQIDRT